MNRYSLRLSATDWVLIGYVAGLVLWFIAETLTADAPEDSRTWNEQQVTLGERDLERLEDGDSVKVRRWHGHDLVIDGTIVVDARTEEGQDDA
ncbi:hypothetical protein ACM16X_04950 [Haloarcula japonica]|uniref:hypothetical protein n=1 Tax=Haloarcula japonica TaxID=29282 RepID=UPI0039F6FE5B